jgi:hypothetical protein
MPTTAAWKRVARVPGQEGKPYQFEGWVLPDADGTYPHEYVSTSIAWTEVTD